MTEGTEGVEEEEYIDRECIYINYLESFYLGKVSSLER